jgi:hypothetical protein
MMAAVYVLAGLSVAAVLLLAPYWRLLLAPFIVLLIASVYRLFKGPTSDPNCVAETRRRTGGDVVAGSE